MFETKQFHIQHAVLEHCGRVMVAQCHGAALAAGWWHDLETGERKPFNVLEKLMLAVTEIAEAAEGARKDLMDDHLPMRPMLEVEIADAIIRLADLAGAMELDVGGAIAEKLLYNQSRADHKPAARLAPGGKKA